MHTALLRGQVSNPRGRMVAGQFITAAIQLPPPADEVEVPTEALIEDGTNSVVFVQEVKGEARVHRASGPGRSADQGQDFHSVRTPGFVERSRGCQALLPGEQVVVGGA